MNRKQRLTLEKVRERPERSDLPWKDIENMLSALGAEISEGSGSRVRVYLNGVRAVFHRPHPQKETDKGAVKSVRRFLEAAGE
ncbi:type II toxin-antitoxin system HicA family toxin [Pelagicoccus sp. NFK12]|uniref:Type II toxin-antitoxin system HicA family toxin n=1 Tax=Pelagicoccus enzymogenes TaxID=2773457 RepID=A0A927IH62_9BACT|nr:type II toxin-antitoxin system HicA family toxin [Pelagicoccus enzymogenes]MBD5779863.1 type II toxin-antitoxin system HicA family toxin [Pelagicoccus enzymogenes]MBD5779866.1 type II toxin-antitoxin system HicA family toxin [Pelagicoccus enzymogenes]MBD5779987.1 type II toxin-antitoxin system HicA family toxin [Pelagicoccus enzymogenes]